MSCPICSHTMESLLNIVKIWWCPRCGTIKAETQFGSEYVSPPKLVNSLLEFEGEMGQNWCKQWHKFGIHQSIHPEGERYFDKGDPNVTD